MIVKGTHKLFARALCVLMCVVSVSCGVSLESPASPSPDEMTSAREAYETAFFRLEAAADATDQALTAAYECEEVSCWDSSLQAADQALRAEDEAYLEFSTALDGRMRVLDALAEECRSCPRYITASHEHAAAERMFQQARRLENGLYLEVLRCDTDACLERVTERLDAEAVPRRADAARRLNDAQQRMMDAEAAAYQELTG